MSKYRKGPVFWIHRLPLFQLCQTATVVIKTGQMVLSQFKKLLT